jgi:hypothetical protein
MLHQSLAPQELACDAEVTALSKKWQAAMVCYRSRVDVGVTDEEVLTHRRLYIATVS